ncbi:SKP1-like protein 21 [Glycine max]|nr:SKP1-like protein 21 [Glycine max]
MLREVEDFARRLNSDWPERMQILSLGQDRRLVTISMNSNGSTQLYTGSAAVAHNSISKGNYFNDGPYKNPSLKLRRTTTVYSPPMLTYYQTTTGEHAADVERKPNKYKC